MKTKLATLLVFATLTVPLFAPPVAFDFKVPSGLNSLVFKLDAPLGAINGRAVGVAGTVWFEPQKAFATTGQIVVDATTLTVSDPLINGQLQGEKWLDTAKFKAITFQVKQLANVKSTNDITAADVSGTLTVKGVAKEITIPVTLAYLRGGLSQRVPNQAGDLLLISTKFAIKRTDFGINPGASTNQVPDEIQLSLDLAGAFPQR